LGPHCIKYFTVYCWTHHCFDVFPWISYFCTTNNLYKQRDWWLLLTSSNWLPVRQRILFKTAVLVFQCLAGQAPSYLSDDCQPVSHSRPRHLRSSDSLTCVVRRAHNMYGDRCFATAGPRVWNSLPIELQQCDSLGRFKRCLNTFLFGSWNYSAL